MCQMTSERQSVQSRNHPSLELPPVNQKQMLFTESSFGLSHPGIWRVVPENIHNLRATCAAICIAF